MRPYRLQNLGLSKPIFLSLKMYGVSRNLWIPRLQISPNLMYVDHGDHIIITRSKSGNGGGLIMLGRSDGVLSVLRSITLLNWSSDRTCVGIPEESALGLLKSTT